jgi:hypothetical protein
MNSKITQEMLDELIPSLKALDTQSAAVLEFLKHEGIASDEKLAPYLQQAASASNVRWLGVRVRIERLLSFAEKDSAAGRSDKKEENKLQTTHAEAAETSQSDSEAEDNSKSIDQENLNDKTTKDKNPATMSKNTDSRSDVSPAASSDNQKTRDRQKKVKHDSKPAVTGEEKRIA